MGFCNLLIPLPFTSFQGYQGHKHKWVSTDPLKPNTHGVLLKIHGFCVLLLEVWRRHSLKIKVAGPIIATALRIAGASRLVLHQTDDTGSTFMPKTKSQLQKH